MLGISNDDTDQDCKGVDSSIVASAVCTTNRKGNTVLTVNATIDGGQWRLRIKNLTSNPGSVRISGAEGTIEVVVTEK